MASRWNDEMTAKFVQRYRDEEVLWNINSSMYRHRQAREAATNRLVECMGIENFGPAEVRIKIKSLRSTYVQEVAKIKKSKYPGAGVADVYVPKMAWFSIMHNFLEGIDTRKEKSINVQEDTDVSIHELPEAAEDKQTPEEPSSKRAKIGRIKVEEITTYLKDLDKLSTSYETMDEFRIFGQSVGAQLQKLPIREAIIAQNEIQSLLTRYRLANILPTNGSTTSTTSGVIVTPTLSDDPELYEFKQEVILGYDEA